MTWYRHYCSMLAIVLLVYVGFITVQLALTHAQLNDHLSVLMMLPVAVYFSIEGFKK